MNDRKVTFRRVRGRIIPIRLTDKQKTAAKGAGEVVAGAGIAGAAGKISAGLLHDAAHFENSARGFARTVRKAIRANPNSNLSGAMLHAKETAFKSQFMSMNLIKRSSQVAAAGGAIAGAAIGQGAINLYTGITGKKVSGKTEALVTGAAAAVAPVLVGATYFRSLGSTSGLRHAILRALAKGAK